jgi:two-component system, OmpR family, phosphate regulon response regulator OmpR
MDQAADHILIVDDDAELRGMLETYLAQNGYTAEFTLLCVLLQNPGRSLRRDNLVDLVQGNERTPFDRSIDVRVARLRRKIETDPDNPRHIRTVWGVGCLSSPAGGAT